MAKQHSIIALWERGWSHRRIARTLGIYRETVSLPRLTRPACLSQRGQWLIPLVIRHVPLRRAACPFVQFLPPPAPAPTASSSPRRPTPTSVATSALVQLGSSTTMYTVSPSLEKGR